MFDYEHDDAVRSVLRRARLIKVYEDKNQQKLNLAGLRNERPEKVVRVLDHGFSSHPPKDSEGVMLQLGSRSDRTLAWGFEHKDKRPKDLPEGAVALYDADGKILKMWKDKTEWDAGDKPWELTNATTIKINGKNDLAIGVDGRWVRVRPNRVDLGVVSPTDEAPHKVETTGGPSNIVYAVV